MSTKKIIKKAKKHPELFSPAEISYFKLIRKLEKQEKQKQKQSND
jgi:hypothetical protein